MRPYLLFIALLSVCQYVNELIYLNSRNVKNTGIEPITSLTDILYQIPVERPSFGPYSYLFIILCSPGQI